MSLSNLTSNLSRDNASSEVISYLRQVEHQSLGAYELAGLPHASHVTDNPYVTIGNQQLMISSAERAGRIFIDTNILAADDPSAFLAVAKKIGDLAKKVSSNMVGENHPLAGVLGRRNGDAGLDFVYENIRESREKNR